MSPRLFFHLAGISMVSQLGVLSAQTSSSASLPAANSRDRSFDQDWRFQRGDAPGAEDAAFDDSSWRKLDVPHDWSIEDLPPKENPADRRIGRSRGQMASR